MSKTSKLEVTLRIDSDMIDSSCSQMPNQNMSLTFAIENNNFRFGPDSILHSDQTHL